jgi:hypothetical protein
MVSFNEPFMSHPMDHIMANTWRLIFERAPAQSAQAKVLLTRAVTDFSELERLLPEYRLIGFSLANHQQRRYD